MTRRALAVVFLTGWGLLGPAATTAAAAEDGIELSITPTAPELLLGEAVTITIDVANTGTVDSEPLAIHIDVTRPDGSGSVDPEDWSATLTRRVGSIAAGATTSLDWRLQPIAGGTFRAYAVALPVASGEAVFVSNGITLRVEEQRSLNPNGILPVALGAPAAVGALLATRFRPFRRRPGTSA